MSDILQRILAAKASEVAAARAAVSQGEMERRAAVAPPPRDFAGASAAAMSRMQSAPIARDSNT